MDNSCKQLNKSSRATLRSLRQFKRFTYYKIRKTLAETLSIQRTQNTVAGYVLGRYTKESEFITTLGWLPVQEMMEFAIVKYTFSVLNDQE